MDKEQDTGNTDDEHSKRLSGNSGELRALNELKGNFIVPGYQRGYRWNDQQINDFLNDIFEFYEQFKNGKENKIYFLQPIMVVEKYSDGTGNEEKDPEINIVDGQQRLTTVLLLNSVLLNNYVGEKIGYGKSINKPVDRDAIYLDYFAKATYYIFPDDIQKKNDSSRCDSEKSDFINYTLTINTRDESDRLLKRIANGIEPTEKDCGSIDLYFIYNAYRNIKKYIDKKNEEGIDWSKFYETFAKQVKVLWYVIDDSDSSGEIAAFTRLNSGKIPLTNAELSRAALLNPAYYKSQNNKDANENLPDIETERGLISVGWDNLEYELRKPEFWGFLGFSENDYSSNVKDRRNKSFEDERYQTRIDFLLDFHFNKKSDEDNKLASFMALEKELKNAEAEKFAQKNVKQIWEAIQLDLWKLQTWYDDNDLYHWIGYLFAQKQMNQYLFSDFKDLEKDKLKEEVKGNIKSFYPDLETVLEYTYETDRAGCQRALFLYNVEYVRSMKTTGKKPRYDFSAHHQKKWSIEHIKAQNVEELNTKEQWLTWLEGHLEVVASISPRGEDRKKDDLKKDGSRKEDNLQSDNLRRKDDLQPLSKHVEELMDKLKSSELFEYSEPFKLPDTKEEFLRLSKRILEFFDNRAGPTEVIDNRLHELSNLALLDRTANSALNNSIFRVKQNKIVEEMKQGNFIPPATQAVFLRLFSMEEQGHLYWTAKDRKAYQDDIKEKLEYLLG
ncbi:DUF262 domain-containing protein [Bartonella choladocola]|uniref:GmrSD restriction endonucleases N-terminal domain-containing protein n=1 Tax=Bartonella choladocola TaxID=2750995 RepID=A0A1U9MG52_9HYPH|nr:DUF262 domain-containing protein [Bartonella choladocola]AQT46925.1 Protein of unknown function DUF262 [Bartonella choladocola]